MTQQLRRECSSRISYLDTLASTLKAELNPAPAAPSAQSRDLALLIRALRGVEEQLPGSIHAVLRDAREVAGQVLSKSADFAELGRLMIAGVAAFAATYALHARSLSSLDTDRKELDGLSAVLLNDARMISAAKKAQLRPALVASAHDVYLAIADEAIRHRVAAGTVKEGMQQYERTLPLSAADRDRGVSFREQRVSTRQTTIAAPQIESHNPGGIMMERLR